MLISDSQKLAVYRSLGGTGSKGEYLTLRIEYRYENPDKKLDSGLKGELASPEKMAKYASSGQDVSYVYNLEGKIVGMKFPVESFWKG